MHNQGMQVTGSLSANQVKGEKLENKMDDGHSETIFFSNASIKQLEKECICGQTHFLFSFQNHNSARVCVWPGNACLIGVLFQNKNFTH